MAPGEYHHGLAADGVETTQLAREVTAAAVSELDRLIRVIRPPGSLAPARPEVTSVSPPM
jgi:hypothetical protein